MTVHEHHERSNAFSIPAAVYPLLQGGLSRCGYRCSKKCPGPTPVNSQPVAVSKLTLPEEIKKPIASTWWITEGAQFQARRVQNANVPTYALNLLVVQDPKHGAIKDSEQPKKKKSLQRGMAPNRQAALKKHEDGLKEIEPHRDAPYFEAICRLGSHRTSDEHSMEISDDEDEEERTGDQSLDTVVNWAIWFNEVFNETLFDNGILIYFFFE